MYFWRQKKKPAIGSAEEREQWLKDAALNEVQIGAPPDPTPVELDHLQITLKMAETVQKLQTAVSTLQRELAVVQGQLQKSHELLLELLKNHSILEDYLIKVEFATRRPVPFHKRLKYKRRVYDVPHTGARTERARSDQPNRGGVPRYEHVTPDDKNVPSIDARLAAFKAKKANGHLGAVGTDGKAKDGGVSAHGTSSNLPLVATPNPPIAS